MTTYLSAIHSPADLKKLPLEALPQLSQEIRDELLTVLSRVGGHLGGNLGVVELTIALHYVFNSPVDRLVWDTGHQSYVHKMLTGRLDRMMTIRQLNGLSGFAKITESEHDIYGAGHASTSISAAYGLAVARDLSHQDHNVIAVIGDGALTGGMAFEGLNNLGHSQRKMLVILNDNSMSIDKNVGAISDYLTQLLTDETYNRIKHHLWELTGRFSLGPKIRDFVGHIDETVKGALVPGVIFEKLGLRYFGPIDGHDVVGLVKTLRHLKPLQGPMLLHIRTVKGKGYKPAEEDECCLHGVSKFDKVTGRSDKSTGVAYTKVFANTICELGREHSDLVAITAAMPTGTGLVPFSREFPDRFYDVGIAEQHGAVFAAGLAREGKKPVFAVYSTFLQRAFDPVIHDIALQKLPVLFALDRAGLVGNDGPTHHGTFDIAYLRLVPGMVIVAPKDGTEMRQALHLAVRHLDRPIAVRWPRGDIPEGQIQERPIFKWGTWEQLRDGSHGAILAVGTMVQPSLQAAETLAEKGIDLAVINCRFIKPFDEEMLSRVAARYGTLITVEEGCLIGGFGSGINDWLTDKGYHEKHVLRLGIPDEFVEHGNRDELMRIVRLDTQGIAESAERFVSAEGKRSLQLKHTAPAVFRADKSIRRVAKGDE